MMRTGLQLTKRVWKCLRTCCGTPGSSGKGDSNPTGPTDSPFLPSWLWWFEWEMSPIDLGTWKIGSQSLTLFVELAEPLRGGALLEEVHHWGGFWARTVLPHFLFALLVYIWRCALSASCSSCHVRHLLPIVPAMMDCYPSGTISQIKLQIILPLDGVFLSQQQENKEYRSHEEIPT